jgi:hypothetical protein
MRIGNRGGHASEATLMAIMAGEPETPHVASCALCQAALSELRAWADQTAADAAALADQVFTPERLANQQAEILRRLEAAGRQAKVIAFPIGSPLSAPRRSTGDILRWATAAAIVFGIGLASGRLLDPHEVEPRMAEAPAPAAEAPRPVTPAPGSPESLDEAALLEAAYERVSVDALDPIDEMTPRAREVALNRNSPRRRR